MITVTRSFVSWLMGLTRLMRYFVIAVLLHVVALVFIGSIKIVEKLPPVFHPFKPVVDTPPPVDQYTRLVSPEDLIRETISDNHRLGKDSGRPGGPMPGSLLDTKSDPGQIDRLVSHSPDALPEVRPGGGGSTGSSLTDLISTGTGGTSTLPGLPGGGSFEQRFFTNKVTRFNDVGCDQRTETAVIAALRWLKDNQKPDGSWPMGQSAQAGTALALLAFTGHGETPDSPDFGATITKGFQYLIGQVRPNGDLTGNMYVEGLAGLALAEAYGMTKSPPLREPLERVTRFIVAAQKAPKTNPIHAGGWRYTPQSIDADLSVAGWQIMALRSARDAGIAVPTEVFVKAADYVWNMYGTPGFGYTGPGATPTMTAVGVLCQQFLGSGADKRVRPALEYLAKQKMDWDKAKTGFVLYGWYYLTQAAFQGGPSYWTARSDEMKKTLLRRQKEDGHWDSPGISNEKEIGPVYSTTLCTLMLEVYYRHLRLYQLTDPTVVKQNNPTMPYRSYL